MNNKKKKKNNQLLPKELKKGDVVTRENQNSNQQTTKNEQFAIISYLNSQFKVSIGTKLLLPLSSGIKANSEIIFEKVLMKNDAVGNPYIPNFVVIGKCLKEEVKDKKIIVFKYKAKKNYRVKTGHRQKYTLIKITKFEEKKRTTPEI